MGRPLRLKIRVIQSFGTFCSFVLRLALRIVTLSFRFTLPLLLLNLFAQLRTSDSFETNLLLTTHRRSAFLPRTFPLLHLFIFGFLWLLGFDFISRGFNLHEFYDALGVLVEPSPNIFREFLR